MPSEFRRSAGRRPRLDVTMPPAPGGATKKQGEMRHHATIWSDPSFADQALGTLTPAKPKRGSRAYLDFAPGDVVAEWLGWLASRSKPASAPTREKYRQSVKSFCEHLRTEDRPLTLAEVTPAAVGRWVGAQRRRGCAEEGIASRLAALKAFTSKFVHRTSEWTNWDLLEKAERLSPEPRPKPRLTDDEIRLVRSTFPDSYDGERDFALVTVYLATGCRLSEVLRLERSSVDLVTGRFVVLGKGGKERPCKLGAEHLKILRRWLRVRMADDTDALWTTAAGHPLSYWGAQDVFRRIRARTGVAVHAHLCRHTFAQAALEKNAERAMVQDMLGHSSDAMLRRYTKLARAETAAEQMPRFAAV